MFIYEFDKALELLKKYELSIVRENYLLEEWLEGAYQCLVPKIITQLIAAARFMEYMDEVIQNDKYPNLMRMRGEEALYDENEANCGEYAQYKGVFNDLTRAVANHLMEQKRLIGVNRYELRDSIWTEENYYELRALNRVMDTMCLLCNKVFDAYYEENGPYDDIERERQDNIIRCPWEAEEVDYPWETQDDPYAGDNIEDIYPPLWVKSYRN